MAKDRSTPIDVDAWWHDLAVQKMLYVDDEPRGGNAAWAGFGKKLAKHIGRATGFSRTILQNTIHKKKGWTVELIQAIQIEFPDLPRFYFVARDAAESMAMDRVWRETNRRLYGDIAARRVEIEHDEIVGRARLRKEISAKRKRGA